MIPALFATLLSLAPSFASTTTVQSYICNPPDKPAITAPSDGATLTSGPVTLTGTGTASSTIVISLDGADAAQTTADAYNNFDVQISLPSGKHRIDIASNSPCGNRRGDQISLIGTVPATLTVTTPPLPSLRQAVTTGSSGGSTAPAAAPLTITVLSPHDHTTTTGASVYVRGNLSRPGLVRIVVNGTLEAQTFTPSQSFGLSVPLQIGLNGLTIQATADGDTASAGLDIRRIVSKQHSATPIHWWQRPLWEILLGIAVGLLVIGLLVWFIVLAV